MDVDDRETPVTPMQGVVATPPGLGEKRPRDHEFVDVEDGPPTPTELPGTPENRHPREPPKRELTLQDTMDTMTRGFSNQESNMTSMRKEMGEVQKETREAKTLSAKAVTIANETRESMESLEKRVAALEAGPPRQEWEVVEPQLPPELKEVISEVIVPNSQCQIVIVKIRQDPKGPRETRQQMLEWGKKFRALQIRAKAQDETAHRIFYAQPCKPFEMRQRNAKTMGMLDGLKTVVGPEKATKLRSDLANGRIFYERTLLAERAPGNDVPSPRTTAVKQLLPDTTRDQILESTRDAMNRRETERKGT